MSSIASTASTASTASSIASTASTASSIASIASTASSIASTASTASSIASTASVRLPPHLQHLQHLQGDELKEAVHREYVGQAMAFILRQTDYDEETAFKQLCEWKDPVKVVSEYLGVKPHLDPHAKPQSKNQMKYGEIRKFMDFGARQYQYAAERSRQSDLLSTQQKPE